MESKPNNNPITKIGTKHGHLPEDRESRRLSRRRFLLLGATTKRLADNDSPYTVGQFGSRATSTPSTSCLRAKLFPVVFCGNHKLEFGTKPGKMKALEGETGYNRVVVKHGGTDEDGTSVTYTEELSQTDEYGAIDWNCLGMAFREFVSNAIDAAIAVNRQANGNVKWPWDGVKVELVPEEKVRAKRGWTSVFVPADNEEVIRFFANLGKWFLHFSSRNPSPTPSSRRSPGTWTPIATRQSSIVVACGCGRSSSIRPSPSSITT